MLLFEPQIKTETLLTIPVKSDPGVGLRRVLSCIQWEPTEVASQDAPEREPVLNSSDGRPDPAC